MLPVVKTDIYTGTISSTVKKMIEYARKHNVYAEQNLNGVTVGVAPDSSHTLIMRDWARAMNGCIEAVVSPHPKTELSIVELARDARIVSERRQRIEQEQKRYADERQQKSMTLDEKIKGVVLELRDPELWKTAAENNQDDYGRAILAYAERWAKIMQLAIAQGKTVQDVAQDASHEADVDIISGAMFGFAKNLLKQAWKYGNLLT